jgi:cytochrome c oxidase subunit 2
MAKNAEWYIVRLLIIAARSGVSTPYTMNARFEKVKIGYVLATLMLVGAGCSPISKNEEATESQTEQKSEATDIVPQTGTVSQNNLEGSDANAPSGDTAGTVVSSGMPVPGTTTTEKIVVSEPAAGARTINVTAKSWNFSPAEIKVKVGEKIHLVVSSVDVHHGLAIPAVGVKIDLEPGKTASADFTAGKAGAYPFFCDVFCGEGHREMRGTLIVE